MASYKDKLTRDLDRWIEAGLVAADKRQAILASVPDPRRLDAATALAWIGGALLGVAVIAFVAANWDGLPRLARFAMLLGFFAGAAGAGAWAAWKSRPILADIALTLAALIYAASIGLTGQIFDIAGDPQAALRAAAVAAMALALAGRSTGAGVASIVLAAIADLDFGGSGGGGSDTPWLLGFAPLAVVLSLLWKSTPLAHAAAVGGLIALLRLALQFDNHAALFLVFAIVLGGAAAIARWLWRQDRAHAGVFFGWATAGALLFFAIAGYAGAENGGDWGLTHRIFWLAASGAIVALGRHDRHMMITAIGVISFGAAIWAILNDLGLDLMVAAGVFLLCALAALIAGLALRRRTAT